MNFRRIFSLFFFLLSVSGLSLAASPKVITLSDGSVIKGEIIKMDKGIYTIKTENLGEVQVEEEKVISISAQAQTIIQKGVDNTTSQGSQNSSLKDQAQSTQKAVASTSSQSSSFKDQAQQIQGQVMGNQEIMGKIQSLLDDPQIKQIISDPNLLKDIMTYDEETIRNNANVQQLLNNPRIQNLIKEIEQETQ